MKNTSNVFKLFICLIVSVIFITSLTSTSPLKPLSVEANAWPEIKEGSSQGEVKFQDDGVVDMDDPKSDYSREQKAFLDDSFTDVYEDQLPEVNIDDVLSWIYRKGYDIIRGLQVLAQPLTILAFIWSAIIMLFGIFGRNDKLGQGITGMVISGFSYVTILYAPTILKAIVSFFTT